MDLQFVSPQLSQLDALESEILACSVWEDRRPCDGVAGLCDWRLSGRISKLFRSGFLTGARGEVMMVPGRPLLPFDKVLLFGAGVRGSFDEPGYRVILDHMLETIGGLRSRMAVVQLPGRQSGLIAAERAADMLLEVTSREPEVYRNDVWTLVEDTEARRRIQQHMVEERRRIRRR
jgi:hypothetical protein